MGTFTRGPMWLQLAQHLLLFWLIHYSDATPFKELTTELADPSTLGCYYNYNHYSEGDRILTNEPCLNCTCHNKMLMCYLRVCPFTKPIGQDCTIEKREDQCCPIITCPEVPVELVDHSSGLHSTSLAMPDRYGCHINNQFYAEGSQIPSNPKKPCELCYCIRNMTSCVMQECTLHVEGCSPIYNRDVCCPVRYDCGREAIDEELLLEESTTTVRPTPGFMLTTTMVPDQNHCVHNNEIYAEGEVISTDQPCEHCYCMRGDIVCAVQECSAQLENRGKHCKPRPPQIGQCCPDTYDCDIEGETTEESLSLTTTSPSDISTESDNINEIEDDGLTKPLPITEHIDEFDRTTIASIGQRFDASGESSTQSILKDLIKLQDKLEVTTMLYSAFDEDIDMNTVVPFKIPGEGSCLIDGVTYTNSSKIPVTNKCDKSCVCLNSLPQCIPIECDEPAATSNCKLIQNDDSLCCPVYDCKPPVTTTETAVSETERSTEAFTETSTGVTKSLDIENVTELIVELPTEKEPTATEQPEEPSTSEKLSESVQGATTQPSAATEDKVTTQVAIPEEDEFVTVTVTPLETAKTQEPLTAELGMQSPTEESTKLPVVEEIAVTRKAYTVGPTEGISEVTTIEALGSTEQSTEVAEEFSSDVPDVLGTRGGEVEVRTPVEGLIPVESHVTPTEKIEEETSTLSREELIAITEKTITPTQVQPEETASEAIEGTGSTEESVSSTQSPLSEEQQTEVSEHITERGTTSAPSDEGSTRKPIPIADVTEKTLPEEEQTEEITEKGSTLAPSEEGSTRKPIPSADVTEKTLPGEYVIEAEEGDATEPGVAETQRPISEEIQTDVTETISAPSDEGLTGKPIPSADVTEKALSEEEQTEEITEKLATSAPSEEGSTRKQIPSVEVTEKTLPEESQTEEIVEQVTTSAPSDEATTKKPIPSAGVTEKTLSEEEQTEETTEKEATSAPSDEGSTRKPIPSADVTEKTLAEEEQTEEITEKFTTSAPSEEGSTGKPIPSADVTEKAVPKESITEEISGITQESIVATEKPLPEGDQTEGPDAISEKSTTSAYLEEGTTIKSYPGEVQPIKDQDENIIVTESPTEEISSDLPDILGTREGEIEVHTTVQGIIPIESHVTQETPASDIEEEGATKKPISPIRDGITQVSAIEEPLQEEVEVPTERSVTEAPVKPSYDEVHTEIAGGVTEKAATLSDIEEGTIEASTLSEGEIVITEKPITPTHVVPQEVAREPVEVGDVTEESILSTETPLTEKVATESVGVITEKDAIEEGVTSEPRPSEDLTEKPIVSTQVLPLETVTESAEITAATEKGVSATEVAEGITEKGTTSIVLEEGTVKFSPTEVAVTEKTIEKIPEISVSEPAEGSTEKTSTEKPQTIPEKGTTLTTLEEGTTKESRPTEGVTEKTLPEEAMSESAEGIAAGEGVAVTHEPVLVLEHTESITEKSTFAVLVEGTTKPSQVTDVESEELIEKYITKVAETTEKATTSPIEAIGDLTTTQKSEISEESSDVPDILGTRGGEIEAHTSPQGTISIESHVTEEAPASEIVASTPSIIEIRPIQGVTVTEESTSEAVERIGATEASVVSTQTPLSGEEQPEEITEKGTTSAPSEEGLTGKPIPSADVTEKTLPEEGQIEEIIEKGATSVPEEGSTKKPISIANVTERILPVESVTEAEEGDATESSIAETQKPISEVSPTDVPETLKEKGATSAPDEEGLTRKSIPSADVIEETLTEEEQTEEITEKGATSAPEEGSTKPIPIADVTEKTLPGKSVTEKEEGSGATEPSIAETQKPISEESHTEVPETITEKIATSAPSEEGSTTKPAPSADVTEKTLHEESVTEAEEGSGATEPSVAEEAEEGSGATEPSVAETQTPISEESQTEVPETITGATSTPSEEGSTTKPVPSGDVTEKTLLEESVTEAEDGSGATEPSVAETQKPISEISQTEVPETVTEKGATSAPSEEGSTRKSIPSADVTENTIPEEEKTEEITEKSATSALFDEGTTRKSITSADVTEMTLPEEGQTEEITEKGAISAPSDEGSTRKSIPSADVTEKAVPEESVTEEISGSTEPGVATTQKTISEESQTDISETITEKSATSAPSEEGSTIKSIPSSYVTEKILSEEKQTEEITERGATSAPSEEVSTGKPIPSADVTEKTLPEESVTEAEEGSGATEPSIARTQKPTADESQTEVSESITEKGITLAALEEGTTKQSLTSERITEKASTAEPAEGSGVTEKPVSVTEPSSEVQTESTESITEKGTTASSVGESRTTILDIISPPQTIVPQKIEDITQPSIYAVTSSYEQEIPSEATESEAEVTKTVSSTESELAATEKTERPEGPKEAKPIEQETEKETETSAITQASAELGATEVTEKELEISSGISEILGTRYGEIEAHTTSKEIIQIDSHVTEEVLTSEVTEEVVAASTPSSIGEEGASEKPISPIRDEGVISTEVFPTLQPSQEEAQTEISTYESTTSKDIDDTTRPSVPLIQIVSGEKNEAIKEPIKQTHIEPQEATREPETEEIVSSTQIPLSEEGQTAAPESITEQGTTLATSEEPVTKGSLPIDVTQESASEPAEVSGATEESASPTQKPLSEEVRTEVPEGITEKGTTAAESEATTKESRPSDIDIEKEAEGSTVSSVEVGEKFGGDLTTEVQKITTIFDIISPPQTTVSQPAEVSDLTTTQSSKEEITPVPTGSSEEPITETNVEVTQAAEPLVTEGVEKTEEPLVQGVTEEISSAVDDLTSQKVDLTTVSAPSEEGYQTEKAVTAGQVPTETEVEATEKRTEGITETTEPTKSIKDDTVITDSPIISATQEAYKESEKIFDENVTPAAEGTTLSGVDFEQKFGEDNKTESFADINKMTTILDIIFPTKAPVVQHEEVEQTTVALDAESEKEIAVTTEKLAVTEKEYVSTKAPSVDQTTYKPTVPSSSETPSGQYDSGYEPGTSHYPGQTYLEEDYGDEEDQTAFGPGTCRYGGKLYVSAQQIPRDDPCDFCFCFRSDIICLQQSCPPPINGCHEEPIQGFCCPRYECPVSMATVVNMTTSTTTTSTTLPPHFLHHAYKGAATKSGCQIDEHTYQVGDMVPSASGPCIHCICGGDGQMKCDPKQCTPEPMLRQMIAITSRR